MLALTLRQPYASMVAGQIPGWLKTIETRFWSTRKRGSLLICSGKAVLPGPTGYDGPDPRSLPLGKALCVVDLVKCCQMRPEDWAAGCCDPYTPAYGFHLENLRVLDEPFDVRGFQSFFDVKPPDSLIRQFPMLRDSMVRYARAPEPLLLALV